MLFFFWTYRTKNKCIICPVYFVHKFLILEFIVFVWFNSQVMCKATGSNPEPNVVARLDENEIPGELTTTSAVVDHAMRYTGKYSATVQLKSMARDQAVQCLANINHGLLPSLESGQMVKVNLGKCQKAKTLFCFLFFFCKLFFKKFFCQLMNEYMVWNWVAKCRHLC